MSSVGTPSVPYTAELVAKRLWGWRQFKEMLLPPIHAHICGRLNSQGHWECPLCHLQRIPVLQEPVPFSIRPCRFRPSPTGGSLQQLAFPERHTSRRRAVPPKSTASAHQAHCSLLEELNSQRSRLAIHCRIRGVAPSAKAEFGLAWDPGWRPQPAGCVSLSRTPSVPGTGGCPGLQWHPVTGIVLPLHAESTGW